MVFYSQIYNRGVTSGSGAGAEWCRALLPPGFASRAPCSHSVFFFFCFALCYCTWVILRLFVHAGEYVPFSNEPMERTTQSPWEL